MSDSARRQGRPPVTDVASLRTAALPVIERRGYERVSMSSLAGELGVSVRTLHRYFPAKADIVWGGIDHSLAALTASLHDVAEGDGILDAVAAAVERVLDQNAEDLPTMRARIRLIARTPALRNARSTTFERWREELIRFTARRRGEAPTALVPVVLGSALHEAISQALGWWALADDGTSPGTCVRRAFDALTALPGSDPLRP